jgi:hypothetical protein
MDNRDMPELRLAKVLQRQKEEVKSYVALARAIAEANQGPKKVSVDRRKLKRIVERQNVSLSVRELIALDAYLTPLGEGLADNPLLEKPWILQGLVDSREVVLLLGSYPRPKPQRNDLSRWDVQALARLHSEIEKLRPGTQVTFDDVLFDAAVKPEVDPKPLSLPYLKDNGPSVCCIGSPRSCWAAELMLASMFQIEPFRTEAASELPFHFIWSPKVFKFYPSSFALDVREVRRFVGSLAKEIVKERAWAIRAEQTLFPHPRHHQKEWKEYGVVVAQRRGGRVWVVVAGLSGPATYASAVAIAEQKTGTLPELRGREALSPVLWTVVEATVRHGRRSPGDDREVVECRAVLSQTFVGSRS